MTKLPQYTFDEGFYIWFNADSKEEYYSTPLYMYKTNFDDDLDNHKRKIECTTKDASEKSDTGTIRKTKDISKKIPNRTC